MSDSFRQPWLMTRRQFVQLAGMTGAAVLVGPGAILRGAGPAYALPSRVGRSIRTESPST
jgi:hypothetical protein